MVFTFKHVLSLYNMLLFSLNAAGPCNVDTMLTSCRLCVCLQVSFVPLDINDEESIGEVLGHCDMAIQFGEDAEVRTCKTIWELRLVSMFELRPACIAVAVEPCKSYSLYSSVTPSTLHASVLQLLVALPAWRAHEISWTFLLTQVKTRDFEEQEDDGDMGGDDG